MYNTNNCVFFDLSASNLEQYVCVFGGAETRWVSQIFFLHFFIFIFLNVVKWYYVFRAIKRWNNKTEISEASKKAKTETIFIKSWITNKQRM